MPTNTLGTDARTLPLQAVAYERFTLRATAPGAAAGLKVGTLPAGAMITDIVARTGAAFNGTTPSVTVGTNATAYDNLAAAGNIAVTANTSSRVTTGMGQIMAADTPVFAKLGGTGATAGEVAIVIAFVMNNDGQ